MYAQSCNTTLMAWETRRRGGLYYTRSVRVNGIVRRRYLGKDDLARLIASFDEDDQLAREAIAQAWREEKSSALEREAPLIRLDEAIDDLLTATLTAAGYHRHNYGKWRKKRGTHENIPRTDPE
jgi:hypothetical protein